MLYVHGESVHIYIINDSQAIYLLLQQTLSNYIEVHA